VEITVSPLRFAVWESVLFDGQVSCYGNDNSLHGVFGILKLLLLSMSLEVSYTN
jgi:hypothetical protein